MGEGLVVIGGRIGLEDILLLFTLMVIPVTSRGVRKRRPRGRSECEDSSAQDTGAGGR